MGTNQFRNAYGAKSNALTPSTPRCKRVDAPRHQRAAYGPGVLAGARQHERADVGLLERVKEGATGHDDRQHLAAVPKLMM